jgi:uncharacterized protein (TIGR02285 family)
LALPAGATDVVWLVFPTPFTFIADGPKVGQGAGDRQLQYLFQRLPQYRNHELPVTSFIRIWSEMAEKDGICTHVSFKGGDREKVALFTARPMKVTGYRLIAHPRDLDRYKPFMTAEGEVDLAQLVTSPGFRGSYVAARLLPVAVSEALADKERIKADMTPMQTPQQIVQSFAAGRLDFFMSLPIEADFYRDAAFGKEPRIILPLKGVAREVGVYSACSNGPLGRSVIRAIDRIERDDANWADFMAPFHDYFDPADFSASLDSHPERRDPP